MNKNNDAIGKLDTTYRSVLLNNIFNMIYILPYKYDKYCMVLKFYFLKLHIYCMKISFLSICILLFTSIIISTFKNLYLKSNFLIKYDFYGIIMILIFETLFC